MADFSDGFVLSMFFGSGDLGTFRSLSDSGNSITITSDEGNVFSCKYDVFVFEKEIKITKTEGSGDDTTVTTTTEKFTKNIITKLYTETENTGETEDTETVENIIMETIFNEKTGKISGYKDGDGKEVTFVCPL